MSDHQLTLRRMGGGHYVLPGLDPGDFAIEREVAYQLLKREPTCPVIEFAPEDVLVRLKLVGRTVSAGPRPSPLPWGCSSPCVMTTLPRSRWA